MTWGGVSSFRRYTNLAAAIHLLRSKKITLLNPATWDDRNDAFYMSEYKRLKQAKTVLALCFAECPETYHHWHVFSHGSDGICIEFDKQKLLDVFQPDPKIRCQAVQYETLKSIKEGKFKLDELPFLKRFAYHDEREFRIVYLDTEETEEARDYPINVRWIERLTLSPWMPRKLKESVRETLRAIKGCRDLKIRQSTLIDNETWKGLTARVKSGKNQRITRH